MLIAAPWLFDFAQGGAETFVPVALGAGALVYSVFTDYELGAVRRLPMGAHLTLDLLSGLLLAASPWLFGFSEFVYLPHLVLGVLEIGAALMTKTVPPTANPPRLGAPSAGARGVWRPTPSNGGEDLSTPFP